MIKKEYCMTCGEELKPIETYRDFNHLTGKEQIHGTLECPNVTDCMIISFFAFLFTFGKSKIHYAPSNSGSWG